MDAKDEIKQRLDLAEVIKEYIQIKPAGSHAFKAICPFHAEKTPSFHISRDKQIWRCFGCGVGGDMFSFVMQMEGVDFPEALRILGKKAGVEVQRYDTREANEKAQLGKLQAFAAAYYHKVLLDASYAQLARDYCAKRGIDAALIEKFQLGYAPDEWDNFCKMAKQKGFSEADLLNGGLALKRKSGSGVIDRFRHRLMVPFQDVHGNVIGFTGRVFRPEDIPKYMNSPETPLFSKARFLYGLHLAKQAIRRADAVVIVEGNLDVVASHKGGVENVVATSGTALTEFQIDLLKRFTQNLIFSFDADAAGFAAAERGIHLAQAAGMNVSVLLIPDGMGKDPDEVVQKDPVLWQEIVKKPIPIMEYYFRHVIKGKDATKVEDKREIGNKLLPEIGRLVDPIEREHWLQKLATMLRMDINMLRNAIGAKASPSTAKPTAAVKTAVKPAKLSRLDRSRLFILAVFLEQPDLRQSIMDRLPESAFPDGEWRQLYNALRLLYTQNHPAAVKSIYETLRQQHPQFAELLDETALLGESVLADQALKEVRQQLTMTLDYVRNTAREDRRRELLVAVREAEDAGDRGRVEVLLKELQTL